MSVDSYQDAILLTEKIKANLPITAHPSKAYLKLMKQQGTTLASNQPLVIDSVLYMGDEGGISCGILPNKKDGQVYIVSITHLDIDPTHPLASEIQTYQRQRTRKIMVQNSRGFIAEMQRLSAPSGSKKKKGGSFGK